MYSIALNTVASVPLIPPVKSWSQSRKSSNIICCRPTQFKPQRLYIEHFGRKSSPKDVVRNWSSLSICAAAFNATCSGATQTQTVQSRTSTIIRAPIRDKEKSPDLDDGGAGKPPWDRGGGGGGGGGGSPSSGGFFLFAFLIFLDYLKDLKQKKEDRTEDKELESDYQD